MSVLRSRPMPSEVPIGRPIRRRIGRRLSAVAVLLVACAWLVEHEQVRYFAVTSGSMEPTLNVGLRVAADPAMRTPRVGDIIVFHAPAGANPATPVCASSGQGAGFPQPCGVSTPQESRAIFIKRVVAGPGDSIAIMGGRAVRDGVTEAERYAAPCGGERSCSFPDPITVPAGDYYVLGDNRAVSDDSRFWGPVPGAWIIGTVVHCSWFETACAAWR